jgi:hypothetical protein
VTLNLNPEIPSSWRDSDERRHRINQIWKALVHARLHVHFDIHLTGPNLMGPLALRNRTVPFADVLVRSEDLGTIITLARSTLA